MNDLAFLSQKDYGKQKYTYVYLYFVLMNCLSLSLPLPPLFLFPLSLSRARLHLRRADRCGVAWRQRSGFVFICSKRTHSVVREHILWQENT